MKSLIVIVIIIVSLNISCEIKQKDKNKVLTYTENVIEDTLQFNKLIKIPLFGTKYFEQKNEYNINVPSDYEYNDNKLYILNRVENKVVIVNLDGEIEIIDTLNRILENEKLFPLSIDIQDEYLCISGSRKILIFNLNNQSSIIGKLNVFDAVLYNDTLCVINAFEKLVEKYKISNDSLIYLNKFSINYHPQQIFLGQNQKISYYNEFKNELIFDNNIIELENYIDNEYYYLEDVKDNNYYFISLSKDGNYYLNVKNIKSLMLNSYVISGIDRILANQQHISNDINDRGKQFPATIRVGENQLSLIIPKEDTLFIYSTNINIFE